MKRTACYATDVLELLLELDLSDVVVVGHSVSAMIDVLAARREPSRFGALVLVGPSPRDLNDDDYEGGFSPQDIEELLDSLDSNYLGWSRSMAPAIMGNPDRPELGGELAADGTVCPVVASARQVRDADGAVTLNRIALFDSTDAAVRRYTRPPSCGTHSDSTSGIPSAVCGALPPSP